MESSPSFGPHSGACCEPLVRTVEADCPSALSQNWVYLKTRSKSELTEHQPQKLLQKRFMNVLLWCPSSVQRSAGTWTDDEQWVGSRVTKTRQWVETAEKAHRPPCELRKQASELPAETRQKPYAWWFFRCHDVLSWASMPWCAIMVKIFAAYGSTA